MAYLNGEIDEATMKAAALAATRQFAKRQITWLRTYFKDQPTLASDDLPAVLCKLR